MTAPGEFARIEYVDKYLRQKERLFVGGLLVGEWDSVNGVNKDPDEIAETINAAVAPLQAKAELAEELAVALARLHDKYKTHYIGQDDKEARCDGCVALEQWGRLNGKGEA